MRSAFLVEGGAYALAAVVAYRVERQTVDR